MKQILLRYANGITSDYEDFLIHNIDGGGSWHLLKKEPWGYSPVIKPNGTFEDEYLPRIVLAYIEAERGFKKISEQIRNIAE